MAAPQRGAFVSLSPGGAQASEGTEEGKWKRHLHAIRLLKINRYTVILTSRIQMQMRAEIQALESGPLLKSQL